MPAGDKHVPIVVVGSANMDFVFAVERFPKPGETAPGTKFQMFPGGKGANQAAAVARLGGPANFVGAIGKDEAGHALLKSLAEDGVDLADVQFVPDCSTGAAGIWVDHGGENAIVVVPGANARLDPAHVRRCIAQTRGEPIVMVQLETSLEVALAASDSGRLILDPAPVRELPDELLRRTLVLTPNEGEALVLSGHDPATRAGAERAARVLWERGPRHVVITLGERGCVWARDGLVSFLPSLPVEAVDTTAAGDAFNGALACFLAEGLEMDDALNLALRAGALATTRIGAQASLPTRAELRAVAGGLL
ncbi:MAG TPA: ribokinase [Fimbriimonadaceae bacterium]|nr:ribokinase [Fimbriimonadaceae bacterium]